MEPVYPPERLPEKRPGRPPVAPNGAEQGGATRQPLPSRPDSDADLQRLRTLINLVPVVGIVPSLWTLYQSDRTGATVHNASRMAVVLALGWVSATVLLGAGANLPLSHVATLRLLLANGFVGTSYFLISFWLMWRVWQRKSIRLPLLSTASRRLP